MQPQIMPTVVDWHTLVFPSSPAHICHGRDAEQRSPSRYGIAHQEGVPPRQFFASMVDRHQLCNLERAQAPHVQTSNLSKSSPKQRWRAFPWAFLRRPHTEPMAC